MSEKDLDTSMTRDRDRYKWLIKNNDPVLRCVNNADEEFIGPDTERETDKFIHKLKKSFQSQQLLYFSRIKKKKASIHALLTLKEVPFHYSSIFTIIINRHKWIYAVIPDAH